ncbi:hypothetical protein D0T11_02770 [Hymenobacter rubripertinctus]|uniref:Uncharacterized protein n=1 Tax=Hymenobacter rubripertinctus TaxID=2029981 RepID=A0A418R7S8_9BACT|nr:hypothetical protein D0T11_02770 [Hymenobacter rubripertinctus]
MPALAGRYVVRQQAEAAPALPPAYAPWLYLTPAHQALQQAGGEALHFFLEEPATGRTVAQLPVFLPAVTVARSPGMAPFAAVQTAPDLPEPALEAFLAVVEARLAARGVRHLRLRPHAFVYEPAASARLAAVLTRRGYRVALAEINHHLALGRDYAAHLHPSEQRRLRKCARHGLIFEQEPPLLLPLAYEFLSRCRQEKGQELSMSLGQLEALFRALPRQVFLFSVRDAAGEWAALTVAIQVREDVLYNFYPASPLAYNALSPVVLLNAGLHAFGRASHMRLLDLGTSTLPEGGLNQSLLQFKRHLGGVPSLKLTFEKELGGNG